MDHEQQKLKSELDSQRKEIEGRGKGWDSWEKSEAQERIFHDQENGWWRGKGWEKSEAHSEKERSFHDHFDQNGWHLKGSVLNEQENGWRGKERSFHDHFDHNGWRLKGSVLNVQENKWRGKERSFHDHFDQNGWRLKGSVLNEQENKWRGKERSFHDHFDQNGWRLKGSVLNEQENGWRGKRGETCEYQIENPWKKLIDEKNKNVIENNSLQNLMDEHDKLHHTYNDEIKKMQLKARDNFQRVLNENEKLKYELDFQRKYLEWREKELEKCESRNENERKKRIDERIHELEKQLDAKQALELEIERLKIERLKGNLNVMKHMGGDEDAEVEKKIYEMRKIIQGVMKHMGGDEDAELKKKIYEMRKIIEEKEEKLEDFDTHNQILIVKERESNDELQEARNKLIDALKEKSPRATIGVKRMGELDSIPLQVACKRKYAEESGEKSIEFCSLWEDHVRDPEWTPFKVINVGDIHEVVIDEEDEKLSGLRREWGEDVYKAVTNALMEMDEYNPSGRRVTPELWNFREGRKATITEGISCILMQRKQK